jgi:hypothetical protein
VSVMPDQLPIPGQEILLVRLSLKTPDSGRLGWGAADGGQVGVVSI